MAPADLSFPFLTRGAGGCLGRHAPRHQAGRQDHHGVPLPPLCCPPRRHDQGCHCRAPRSRGGHVARQGWLDAHLHPDVRLGVVSLSLSLSVLPPLESAATDPTLSPLNAGSSVATVSSVRRSPSVRASRSRSSTSARTTSTRRSPCMVTARPTRARSLRRTTWPSVRGRALSLFTVGSLTDTQGGRHAQCGTCLASLSARTTCTAWARRRLARRPTPSTSSVVTPSRVSRCASWRTGESDDSLQAQPRD